MNCCPPTLGLHTARSKAHGISYAGAWLSCGFHEEGFVSGLWAIKSAEPPFNRHSSIIQNIYCPETSEEFQCIIDYYYTYSLLDSSPYIQSQPALNSGDSHQNSRTCSASSQGFMGRVSIYQLFMRCSSFMQPEVLGVTGGSICRRVDWLSCFWGGALLAVRSSLLLCP